MCKKVAQRSDKEVEVYVQKVLYYRVFFDWREDDGGKTKYEGYAKLLAKWLDDYYRLKDVKVKVKIRR